MNKQIEEMVEILEENGCQAYCAYCEFEDVPMRDCAKTKDCIALYNAGYRDQKETAREILQQIDNSHLTINLALINEGYYNTADGVEIICSKIKKLIAEKYGIEVE